MANNLTGNYEAVLQLSVRQVNGILATLHQARVDKDSSPSFPHTGSIRVGDAPLGRFGELVRFREWASMAVASLRANTGSADNARAVLSDKTPPGVASMFRQAWHDLDASVREPARTGTVQGRADFQLSAPMISVESGAVSEITVHAWLRARFYPDSGAAPLPAPIHGEVRALYVARPRVLPDGRTVLSVQVTSNDDQIQFIAESGTGLGGADVQAIASHVRRALRRQFAPVDLTLADDFAFSEFTALGLAPTQALVLPLQLSGALLPTSSLPSAATHFLGSNDFAIAVSREFVQRFLDTLITTIKASAAALQISLSGPLGTARYTLSVSIDPLVWKAGAIEISGKIDMTSPTLWAPSGYIRFTQSLTVALDVPSQTVSLQPVGDPAVDESWWLSHGRAVNAVKDVRDKALPSASASLNDSFRKAVQKLDSGLKSFDKSGFAQYTAIDVTPDGLIARGEIGTTGRLSPIVHYVPTDGGTAFTALQSWIPGGRITDYDWTWVERTGIIPWANKTKHIHLEHLYDCPKPADVSDVDGICLQIEGMRLNADGVEQSVTAGQTCKNSSHEPILGHPSWWMKMMLAKWLPDPPDILLPDIIAAHVNVVSESRAPGSITTNVLVHFTGPRMERPLDGLSRALSQTSRRNLSLLVILVLPAGTFETRRSELEARLGAPGERFRAALEITEDYVGGWTKAFAAPDGPSTHLINARGEYVWKEHGGLDPALVARGLAEHALEAPPPRTVPMRLKVEPGMPALEALFTDDQGNQFTLRRLRGRKVLLNFWQSWSTPCVRELRQLQIQHAEPNGPFILAVNGGEGRDVLATSRERDQLTFPLILDPDQSIAGLYGVQCWPTTVSINEEGIVDRIQFGLTHPHPKEPAGETG